MATFRTYDRLLYAKVEATEGTAVTPGNTDYIETIDPTFTITNRVFDRNVTRLSVTPAPKHVTGTGRGDSDGAPSAQCEFSFGVELAGAGKTSVTPNDVPWGKLLDACGLKYLDTLMRVPLDTTGMAVASGTNDYYPWAFRHSDAISNGTSSGTEYTGGTKVGRLVGDTFYKDPYAYISVNGLSQAVASGNRLFGQINGNFINSGNTQYHMVPSGAGVADRAKAWATTSDTDLGGAGSTNCNSLTMQMYVADTGQFIKMKGARGNVEFQFSSGDRCIMQFTFTGSLVEFNDGTTAPTPSATALEIAPSVVGLSLKLGASSYGDANAAYYDGTVFSTFTVNLNNEVVLRDSLNDTTGYESSYISGRAPSLTFNPDARDQTTSYDFWSKLLSGDQTHMEWSLGTDGTGNAFRFRIPSAQFDQIGDGNRDNVMTFDSTVMATGGDNGSSVLEEPDDTSTATTLMNKRLGRNNEFVMYYE